MKSDLLDGLGERPVPRPSSQLTSFGSTAGLAAA